MPIIGICIARLSRCDIKLRKGVDRLPRPSRKRTVYHEPVFQHFHPDREPLGGVTLQVDELEAVRLLDLEHLDQSACAERMNVSRATVQNIINSARAKIADALINGKALEISGGDYIYVEDEVWGCCNHNIKTIQRIGGMTDYEEKRRKHMVLAVTYEDGQIFQHFGKTENFKVYEIQNGEILKSEVVSSNGQGHGALAGVLQGYGVDALICGGIGGGAQVALAENGIKVYGGVAGDCDDAVAAFLNGTLPYQEDITCNHHEHEHGEGGCGGHHEGGHCGGGCHH